MTNLEKFISSVSLEKWVEEFCKRGCPWCPAVEYCKNSPLRCCKEVLRAWAQEENEG